jgi:ribosomal protein L37AE/L43A
MKALKNDPITCVCGTHSGNFLADIKDGARITTDDIAITSREVTDDSHLCVKCRAPVARRLSGGTWQVSTRGGWIE